MATNQHLWIEVAMIDLANMTENSTLLDLQRRVQALENGVASTGNFVPQKIQSAVVPVQAVKQVDVALKSEPAIKKEATVQTNQNEEFTPPPISKKPTGNDITSLWQALLMNIKSPSTTALLKLATPLQISTEGVVITFKNDRLVSQMNDSNKKQLIVDAAKIMFNQYSVPVTVRIAQSNDKQVQPNESISVATQQAEIKLENKPERANVTPENDDEQESAKSERIESDQEKMVLDLFDGKYVE